MKRISHLFVLLLLAIALALGGCDLFESDGGGGGDDGGDSGDGRAVVSLSIEAPYA
jgi:hypothetical protein